MSWLRAALRWRNLGAIALSPGRNDRTWGINVGFRGWYLEDRVVNILDKMPQHRSSRGPDKFTWPKHDTYPRTHRISLFDQVRYDLAVFYAQRDAEARAAFQDDSETDESEAEEDELDRCSFCCETRIDGDDAHWS